MLQLFVWLQQVQRSHSFLVFYLCGKAYSSHTVKTTCIMQWVWINRKSSDYFMKMILICVTHATRMNVLCSITNQFFFVSFGRIPHFMTWKLCTVFISIKFQTDYIFTISIVVSLPEWQYSKVKRSNTNTKRQHLTIILADEMTTIVCFCWLCFQFYSHVIRKSIKNQSMQTV